MPALAAILAASLGSMPSLISELRRNSLLSSPLIKVSMVLLDETSTMTFHVRVLGTRRTTAVSRTASTSATISRR